MEADFVVLDSHATAAMRRRMERVETLEEELFALIVLGDDRATVATYVEGRRAYDRGSPARSLPPRADPAPMSATGSQGEAPQ